MELIIILFAVGVFALILTAALHMHEWAYCERCRTWHNLDTLETSETLPLVTRGEIVIQDCRTCAILDRSPERQCHGVESNPSNQIAAS